MNSETAEDQISISLAMVSPAAAPVHGVRITASPFRMPTFRVLRLLQQAGMLFVMAVLSLASYYVISKYFVKSVEVVGVSMVPTLQENNHYLLNLWAFRNSEPIRNDIVVIRDPGDHGLSVKRIIAVPGESVLFKNGKVFVDGRQLDEPYLMANVRTYTYSQAKEQFITCGRDQYFVLGDNRPRSIDSRSYGPVSRHDILGLVKVR